MNKIKFFANEISPDMEGQHVRVAGWIKSVRDLGKIVFVILTDREGELQITFKKGVVSDELFSKIKKVNLLSAMIVEGVVKKAKTKYGYEIIPEKVEIIPAEAPLPIDVFSGKTELSKRINFRTLDVRNRNIAAIFRLKSLIIKAARDWFYQNGFVEINTPVIGLYVAEGGANVFEVDYFGRKAYLRQSPQLYKQLMAGAFEKVFELGPAFRAEQSYTIRHLTEFLSLDAEIAWIDDIDPLLDVLEKLMIHIVKTVRNEGKIYFELLEKELPQIPDRPFPVMSYEEAVRILKAAKIPLEGKEIPHIGEKYLGDYIKKKYDTEFFFITDFPWEIRPFYTMKYEDSPNPSTPTKSMDLLYKGMEIATGSQREHRFNLLVKQMREKGLTPEKFGYYLEAFKYGMPPHGGFGIGVDRLVMQMLDLSNIREAVLFPRDPERLEP